MEELIRFLESIAPIGEEERVFLIDNLRQGSFRKGDLLLEQGTISNTFYFVVKGGVRLFYTTGIEERTAFFYFESEYESFTQQIPSKHGFQCVEDTDVIEITMEQSAALLTRFPHFEFLARVMMEKELSTYQAIIASFIMLSPKERYLKLRKENPEVLERIPQYYLATYIGV